MTFIKTAITSLAALSAVAGIALAQEAKKEIGPGEGQVDIVAWPSYIERGETDIKLPALQRLAEQFGTTVSKLVAAAEEAGSASAVSHPRASRRNVVTNVVRPARTAGR